MELPKPKRHSFLFLSLTALAFAIPWAKKAIPSVIAVILIAALFDALRNRAIVRPPEILAPVSLLAIFLLLLTGTTYSEHPYEAWNEIGIKLSFLIFPLLAFIIPNLSQAQRSNIHDSFIAGCFLFIGIALAHSTYETIQHRDLYYTTYDRLSWYMHPTYAALYQCLNLFLLSSNAIRKKYFLNNAYLHYSAILVVLIFLALLSSKAGYLTAILVLSVVLIQSIRAGLSITKSIGAFALAIVIFSITIINLQAISQRLENAVMDLRIAKQRLSENSDTVSQATSTQMRLVTWQASMQVLMENPFGTGTGDTQEALNTIYLQKLELHPAEKNLNAHNQFLQYGAELGWPALLAIFLCLFALWKSDMAEKTIQLFVLICGLNFLFESMLEVQAGIVFFCFWVLVYSKTQC